MRLFPNDKSATELYNTSVSQIPNAYLSKRVRVRHLGEVLYDIETGKNRFRCERALEKYQTVIENGGTEAQAKDAYNKTKKLLPGVAFSGTFSRRSLSGLISYSGTMIFDFDGIRDTHLLWKMKELAVQLPHVLACNITVSGTGLRIYMPTDLTDVRYHEQAWIERSEFYSKALGWPSDPSCKDVPRISFTSADGTIEPNWQCVRWHVDTSLPPLRDPIIKEKKAKKEKEPNTSPATSNFIEIIPDSVDAMLSQAIENCPAWAGKTHIPVFLLARSVFVIENISREKLDHAKVVALWHSRWAFSNKYDATLREFHAAYLNVRIATKGGLIAALEKAKVATYLHPRLFPSMPSDLILTSRICCELSRYSSAVEPRFFLSSISLGEILGKSHRAAFDLLNSLCVLRVLEPIGNNIHIKQANTYIYRRDI